MFLYSLTDTNTSQITHQMKHVPDVANPFDMDRIRIFGYYVDGNGDPTMNFSVSKVPLTQEQWDDDIADASDKYLDAFKTQAAAEDVEPETLRAFKTSGELLTHVNSLVNSETGKLKAELDRLKDKETSESSAKTQKLEEEILSLKDKLSRQDEMQEKLEVLQEEVLSQHKLRESQEDTVDRLLHVEKINEKTEQTLLLQGKVNTLNSTVCELVQSAKSHSNRIGTLTELMKEHDQYFTTLGINVEDLKEAIWEVSKKMDEDKTNVGGTKDYKTDVVNKIKWNKSE